MSKITLKDLSHSYLNVQNKDEDWAIRNVISTGKMEALMLY